MDAAIANLHDAVNDDIGGRGSKAGDRGLVAHLHIERIATRPVGTRFEQQGVALAAELIVDLSLGDAVGDCPNVRERHARIEYVDIRPEERRVAGSLGARGGSSGGGNSEQQHGAREQRKQRYCAAMNQQPNDSHGGRL